MLADADGVHLGQTDLPIGRVHAQDLHLDIVADVDYVLRVLDLVVGQLGDVEQTLEIIFELDGRTRWIHDDRFAGRELAAAL